MQPAVISPQAKRDEALQFIAHYCYFFVYIFPLFFVSHPDRVCQGADRYVTGHQRPPHTRTQKRTQTRTCQRAVSWCDGRVLRERSSVILL